MKGKEKIFAILIGVIGSVSLIGGSVYAMEKHVRVENTSAPTSSTKAVDDVEKMKSNKELGYTKKISGQGSKGQVNSLITGDSEATDVGINNSQQPTISTVGNGKSYTEEELAKELGVTVEELREQTKTFEFSLSDTSIVSGEVKDNVLISSTLTENDGEILSLEEIAQKLGISAEELKKRIATFKLDLKNGEKHSNNKGRKYKSK